MSFGVIILCFIKPRCGHSVVLPPGLNVANCKLVQVQVQVQVHLEVLNEFPKFIVGGADCGHVKKSAHVCEILRGNFRNARRVFFTRLRNVSSKKKIPRTCTSVSYSF
jgi:hypothetical protein